jgi:hypothetical protein
MTNRMSFLAAVLFVLFAVSPSLAGSSDLAAEPTPAICGSKVPQIDPEKEMLVEHVLYFHGSHRSGDVQGGGNFAGTPFIMDPTAPTGTETKYKTSKPVVLGNDTFGRNAVNGYWLTELDEAARVVCAGSTFHALAASDTITVMLYFDKPYSEATITPISQSNAAAQAGNGVKPYTGRFNFSGTKVAETDISIQFAPASPGAVLAYDSTEAPSSFTYVTIEPKPEPPA